MSIKDIPEKIKSYWQGTMIPLITSLGEQRDIKKDTFIVLTIILIGLAGFGLGKLSALEKNRGEVTIKPAGFTPITTNINKTSDSKGLLVASKGGKKYHFPWCAGASQITEKNKIWFDSYAAALGAGYIPATNCPGLK